MKVETKGIRNLIEETDKRVTSEKDKSHLQIVRRAVELVEKIGIEYGFVEFENSAKKQVSGETLVEYTVKILEPTEDSIQSTPKNISYLTDETPSGNDSLSSTPAKENCIKINMTGIHNLIKVAEKEAKELSVTPETFKEQMNAVKKAVEIIEFIGINGGFIEFENSEKKQLARDIKVLGDGLIGCVKPGFFLSFTS